MSDATSRHYASPAAFRRGLTDRLKNLASQGTWTLAQLQRQIAYDRLLERLYLVDDEWVVKGAAALLARQLGARATIDIDLYRMHAKETAEADLRAAAARDIGDWFVFEIGRHQTVEAGTRLPTKAYIGPTPWAAFHVDVVGSDLIMTCEPELAPPLARVHMPDLEQHGYRVYPLVDHVADKVVATFQRYGEGRLVSTRFKDLIDIVVIARGAVVVADRQSAALVSESGRRGVPLPTRFDVPDRSLWAPGYAAEAKRSVVPMPTTLAQALAVVRPFLDPLLDGTATGSWEPGAARWG
ncbi:MAG: nucleotidyl transferase AbiEii/AbiGii toxin family protein [Acidimicrobiales bacterium]